MSFEFNVLLFLKLRINKKVITYMTTMDYRIIDNKVVLIDGSIVSVPADYFEDSEHTDCYFGKVLKMIDNVKQGRVQWIQYNTKSIEDVDNLQL